MDLQEISCSFGRIVIRDTEEILLALRMSLYISVDFYAIGCTGKIRQKS